MTQYNGLNVNLSNLQLNKLKSAINNATEVTVKLSSNMIHDSNDTNFPHKLLLTKRHVLKLRKNSERKSSVNMKLQKTQLCKTIQTVQFLGRLPRPLLKTGLPLTEIPFKPLAKSDLAPLRLTVTASATDAAIRKLIILDLVWT